MTKTKPRPSADGYSSNGKHRDALGSDHALIWRDGRAQLVPLADATARERKTGCASIEALAISIVERAQVSRGFTLSPEQRGDAVSHLLAAAWHESQRYDGTTGHLCGFVSSRLRWRMRDWIRLEIDADSRRGGRSFQLVSYETVTPADAAVELTVETRPLWQVLGVDLDALSMPARFALVSLAEPLSRGESLSEVAAACEVSRHAARDMMAALADELRALGVAP
jgi:hypothetical protein